VMLFCARCRVVKSPVSVRFLSMRSQRQRNVSMEIVTPAKEALSKLTDSFVGARRRRAQEKQAAKERNWDRGGERDVTP